MVIRSETLKAGVAIAARGHTPVRSRLPVPSSRRYWPYLAAALAAVSVAFPADALAGAPRTFSDPLGDATSAPDITRISVTSARNGTINLRVAFGERTVLAEDDAFTIFLDTDLDAATGQPPYGADFSFTSTFVRGRDRGVLVTKWSGGGWRPVRPPSLAADFTRGAAVAVNARDLGATEAFAFSLGAFSGSPSRGVDIAPNDAATGEDLVYSLIPAPRIREVGLFYEPDLSQLGGQRLRPGQAIAVKEAYAKLTGGRVFARFLRCQAAIGERKLSQVGPCKFRVPPSIRSGVLVITVSVTFRGARERFQTEFEVSP